LFAGLIVILLI